MRLNWSYSVVLALALAACGTSPQPQASPGTAGRVQAQSMTLGAIKSLTRAGTSTLQAGAGLPQGVDGLQSPEFPTAAEGEAAGGALSPAGPNWNPTNRSLSNGKQPHGVSANAGKKAKSNPELQLSFDGLNFRQQRLANGGNQFSVEPPDQGLCAGSGYVLESVNDVLRVYDQAGGPAMGVTDLNTFYGYIPAINRQTGVRGPFVTDPSCYYDQQTSRWFHVVLTLDTAPNGAFLGTNHLDLAVSQTSSPLGAWTIYKLDVSADGTNCVSYFCLGDYPHIGADANGIYLTTNAYQFFGNDYSGAQVYGISKRALAAGASTVPVAYFDTYSNPTGHPGFTIWPATTPDNQFAGAQGGTEYFLSSMAADEANAPAGGTGSSSQLSVWALTNTKSLDTNSPALSLSVNTVNVGEYGIPPAADQKAGDFPLGQCLNSAPCATNYILGYPDPFVEVLSKLDSNDTRMQQVTYANGKLWGALDTGLTINGQNKAGIAWYVLNPSVSGKQVSAKPVLQGYLGLENNNLTYPAIGVTKSGRGVMAFTVVGQDHYPSAGYAGIDAIAGVGDVHIAAEGLGPQDGFTGYKGEVGNPPRPRWGDYGATAVDGNTVWMASEYIGQTCTLAQYTSAPFGSCGGTRATLGNWATRISAVKP